METQRDSLSWGRWSLLLLLLGLAVPPATAQALSGRDAVLLAVKGYNQQLVSEPHLYRLLELDPPREGRVNLKLMETVCPRTTQRPPEQCDFKENGVVKFCTGPDPDNGYFDISCDEIKNVKLTGPLKQLIRKGGQKLGKFLEKAGKKISKIFSNFSRMEQTQEPVFP